MTDPQPPSLRTLILLVLVLAFIALGVLLEVLL